MKSADERLLRLLQEARQKLEQERKRRTEPLAIVGIGCRFPGNAAGPSAFWKLLASGVDATGEVPLDRWDAGALYDADPQALGKSYVKRGAFLDQIDRFEPEFFGISPREAIALDPQQRLLLEVTWEALENAGILPASLAGSSTGVWVGLSLDDYARRSVPQGALERIDAYAALGSARSVAAGRIAYVLGVHGPVLQLDTACSSSLVAVHLACQSLRNGECDLALVGGVSLMCSPEATVALCRLQALAPDGRCKTFDAAADGYGRGEGCGMVVLKRLSDAIAAGDRIHALIRGSAVNHDGRSNGLTAPNGAAQEAVIRAALANGGVEAASVGYVEAHGTGTLLGDPIEVLALSRVYGAARSPDQPLYLGSVKTNLGHLEAAAGIAALIKTALCASHGWLAPHLHFRTPNPKIPWRDLPVHVTSEGRDFPEYAGARSAGVSSFGISGTNAHVLIERAPTPALPVHPPRSAELVVLSARTEPGLRTAAARLGAALDADPKLELADVAYNLLTTRTGFEHRWACAASSRTALSELLAGAAAAAELGKIARREAKLAFVFSGQGSQWLGMGRKLLEEEPAFRGALSECDRAVAKETGWSVLAELGAPSERSQLARIDVVQPVLFSIQVALAALWRAWGVEPDAVVGHSMGEAAAACVAGALSLQDAAAVICRRSALLARIRGQGEMALVELSMSEASAALAGFEDRLSVAVSNAARSTVISGEPSALAEVLEKLEARGVFCRRVKVDVASHSPQVDPLMDDLVRVLADVTPRAPQIPMHSTVTGAPIGDAELGARYWADNLRQPVRFAQTIESLLVQGFQLFVEQSPHPLLVSAIEQLSGTAVGSLRREQPERLALLDALALLHVHGLALKPGRLFPNGGARVELPTYPWQGERYWLEPTRVFHAAHSQEHPLLGALSLRAQPTLGAQTRPLGRDALIEVVRTEVARVLSISSALAVPLDKPLKELGLDSLMALELRNALVRHTSVQLPAALAFKLPTVRALAEHLAAVLVAPPHGGDAAYALPTSEPALDAAFEADANLDADVRPATPSTRSPSPASKSVLLTGATGFLGAFLLHELLERTDAQVHCLVRAGSAAAGMRRLIENQRRYGLSQDALVTRVTVLPGDLNEPRLGLDPATFERLAAELDAIYSNGAELSFVGSYSDLKASHVHGTRSILRLAAFGRAKMVHHVSSAAVFDAQAYRAKTVPESLRPKESRGIHLGYVQCKWVTEALVWEAAARGIDVTVHRPGFIAGSSLTGAWNTADFLCRMTKTIIELGAIPDDLEIDLDFSPVDYVSRAIVHLSRTPAARGRAFHMNHPRALAFEAFGEILRTLGYRLQSVPYAGWVRSIERAPASSLYPLLPFFTHRWDPEGLTSVELWQRAHRARLTTDETSTALRGSGIECANLDERLIDRYLEYLRGLGFIGRAPAAR